MKKPQYRLKPPPGYLNTKQSALRLGVSSRTVRRYIKDGALPAFRARKNYLGSPYRIKPEDVKNFEKKRSPRKSTRQARIISSTQENGCSFCISHKPDKSGYPMMKHKGRRIRVAQYIYEKKNGLILPGYSVEPYCGYKRCIEHLALIPPHTDNKKHRNKSTVLTERIVILGRLDKESSHREFAIKHGLRKHVGAIASARNGQSWKHLNDTVLPLKVDFTIRGERHHSAKLNALKVKAIRFSRGKVSTSHLAKRYGVTPQTIYNIWAGRTWKNIPTTDKQQMRRGA